MDYVDGQLVERHVGEHFHSRMQMLIAVALQIRSRERRFRVFVEQRVLVSTQPKPGYRIPDVCVKALPYHVTPVLERPDLAIEVLSPDDTPDEMLERIADYLRAGVPHIWIVDPYKQKVFEAGSTGIQAAPERILRTDLVGDFDFRPLFQELYEPTE